MKRSPAPSLRLLLALFGCVVGATARADWMLIDDFQSYPVGETIDGQSNGHGEWVSPDYFEFYGVELDPLDADNQVLAAKEIVSGATQVFLDDPRVNVADGTQATLYVRFYRGDFETHVNFGLSDVESPANWPDFEAQFRDQTGLPYARNGGAFTLFDNVDELPEEEWLNYWIVIDNDSDTNEYYLQSETTFPTQLKLTAADQDVFDFRNGTGDPLTTFLLRTNNEGAIIHVGPWYLDDIYLDLSGENLTVPSGGGGLLGDYDGSGMLDVADLDLQGKAIREGMNPTEYDLNSDGLVNSDDRVVWVEDLKNSYVGDANLDGEFNSSDFVAVFTAGKFEVDEPAGWADGDWDGTDQRFTTSDFVVAFTQGGYELGPRPEAAVRAVPEPSGVVLAIVGMISLFTRRGRNA